MAIDSSELPIINAAISKLGQRRITSAQLDTPDNKVSRLVEETYENHRDLMLEDHPWNFAIRRAELDKNVTTPVWGFNFEYDFPDGDPDDYALRILQINDDVLWTWNWAWVSAPGVRRWKVEDRKILTDLDEQLQIRYISRVTEYDDMTAMFKDLLSQKLTLEWAEPLTASDSLGDRAESRFRLKLSEARSIDGQEGIPDPIETSSWVGERFT